MTEKLLKNPPVTRKIANGLALLVTFTGLLAAALKLANDYNEGIQARAEQNLKAQRWLDSLNLIADTVKGLPKVKFVNECPSQVQLAIDFLPFGSTAWVTTGWYKVRGSRRNMVVQRVTPGSDVAYLALFDSGKHWAAPDTEKISTFKVAQGRQWVDNRTYVMSGPGVHDAAFVSIDSVSADTTVVVRCDL